MTKNNKNNWQLKKTVANWPFTQTTDDARSNTSQFACRWPPVCSFTYQDLL